MLYLSVSYVYGQGGGGPVPPMLTTGQIVPLSYCAGDSMWVPYFDSLGTYNVNNIFSVQLSDANGSFNTPVVIGSVNSQVGGIIPCMIPWGIPTGLHYRVRVTSSSPYSEGTDNNEDIEIKSKYIVTFSGVLPDQCENSTTLNLLDYVSVSPQGGTFSGPGVIGTNFNASLAGSSGSPHTITYTYSDGTGCINTATNQIVVLPFPQLSILNLDAYYCTNYHSSLLVGVPSGGTFSGPGMTGNIFNPVDAGYGNHVITYSYTAVNGCSGTYSQSVFVDNCISINEIYDNSKDFVVYPNPSSDGKFYLSNINEKSENISIYVYTVTGVLINKIEDIRVSKNILIDISFLPSGLYFLRINNNIVAIEIKK